MAQRLSVLVAVVLLIVGVQAQSNPRIGTWRLDPAKSKFSPGPAPKAETRIYEANGANGIKVTQNRTTADGKTQTITYAGNYDGKEVPYKGDPNYDGITMTMLKDGAVEAHLLKGGKVITKNNRSVVSPDGKTLTVSVDGTGSNGPHNVSVFVKQ